MFVTEPQFQIAVIHLNDFFRRGTTSDDNSGPGIRVLSIIKFDARAWLPNPAVQITSTQSGPQRILASGLG